MELLRYRGMLAVGIVVAVMAFSGDVQAALSLVTDRGALGGNDYIDWGGKLGDENYLPIPAPIVTTSSGGLGLTVSHLGDNFYRLDEGSYWHGNFAFGDHLLYTGWWWDFYSHGPMSIAFDVPVMGAGAQIQDSFPGTFKAVIGAYDSSDNLLGQFECWGYSGTDDNSAIFLGVLSDTANIARIEYATSTSNDFAINRLDIVRADRPVIPEASTLVLLGLGLVGLVGATRRRK